MNKQFVQAVSLDGELELLYFYFILHYFFQFSVKIMLESV